MRRQFDVGIAFGTFSVVVVGTAAAAAPSPYCALSRNVVETTFTCATPECIIRSSSFRRSKEQNVSKETNLLFLVLGSSSNHPLFSVLLLVFSLLCVRRRVQTQRKRAKKVFQRETMTRAIRGSFSPLSSALRPTESFEMITSALLSESYSSACYLSRVKQNVRVK